MNKEEELIFILGFSVCGIIGIGIGIGYLVSAGAAWLISSVGLISLIPVGVHLNKTIKD